MKKIIKKIQYDEALARVAEFMDKPFLNLSLEDINEYMALLTAIEAYEAVHFPVPKPDPYEVVFENGQWIHTDTGYILKPKEYPSDITARDQDGNPIRGMIYP